VVRRGSKSLNNIGHLVSLSVANADDSFDPARGLPLPLCRGQGMFVSYEELAPAPVLRT
jgi:hypothetical protein